MHVVRRDGPVDEPLGEQRRQQAEQRDDEDAGEHERLLEEVRPKERQDAAHVDALGHLRTIRTERVGPHQVDRAAAAPA